MAGNTMSRIVNGFASAKMLLMTGPFASLAACINWVRIACLPTSASFCTSYLSAGERHVEGLAKRDTQARKSETMLNRLSSTMLSLLEPKMAMRHYIFLCAFQTQVVLFLVHLMLQKRTWPILRPLSSSAFQNPFRFFNFLGNLYFYISYWALEINCRHNRRMKSAIG